MTASPALLPTNLLDAIHAQRAKGQYSDGPIAAAGMIAASRIID